MANWYGFARTNYFRVKDVDAFKEALKALDVEVIEVEQDSTSSDGRVKGMVGLIGRDEYGGFPTGGFDGEDEWQDVEVDALVAEHLVDGEVAVFMEVGAEKMRYLTGRAWAINSKGETRQISIDDIYERAKELGPNVTSATY